MSCRQWRGKRASWGRASVQAGGDGEEPMSQCGYSLFEDHGGLAVGAGGYVRIVLDGRLWQRLIETPGHGGLKEPEVRAPGGVVQPEVADLAEA